ncbi:MAG: hypothetical protein Q7S57_02750 [bacterium]|nr:hypothetical protein [bacterium]
MRSWQVWIYANDWRLLGLVEAESKEEAAKKLGFDRVLPGGRLFNSNFCFAHKYQLNPKKWCHDWLSQVQVFLKDPPTRLLDDESLHEMLAGEFEWIYAFGRESAGMQPLNSDKW